MSSSFIFVVVLAFISKAFTITFGNGNIGIDKDHLRLEPECGKLPAVGSGRISNAKESDRHYPWVVKVERKNDFTEMKETTCGGSIIRKNVVVTAAHCICGPTAGKDFAATKDIRDKIACKGGKGKSLSKPNLQATLYNEVTNDNKIKVGAGDSNWKNLLLSYYEISFAYVHDEYEDEYTTRDKAVIDIGLLKTYENKGENFEYGTNFYDTLTMQYPDFEIGPICIVAEDAKLSLGNFETVGWGSIYGEEQEETTTIFPQPSTLGEKVSVVGLLVEDILMVSLNGKKRNLHNISNSRYSTNRYT